MTSPEKLEEEEYEKMKEEIKHEIAGQNVGISVFQRIISRYRSRRFEIPTTLLIDWVCGDEIDPHYNTFKKKIDSNRRFHREELVVELSKNETIENEIKKVIEQYQKQLSRQATMQKKRKKYREDLEEIIYELNFIYNNLIHCFIDRLAGYLGDEWRCFDDIIVESYERSKTKELQILSPYLISDAKSEERQEKTLELTYTIYPEITTEDRTLTFMKGVTNEDKRDNSQASSGANSAGKSEEQESQNVIVTSGSK